MCLCLTSRIVDQVQGFVVRMSEYVDVMVAGAATIPQQAHAHIVVGTANSVREFLSVRRSKSNLKMVIVDEGNK